MEGDIKVGDRVRITLPGYWNGHLGTVIATPRHNIVFSVRLDSPAGAVVGLLMADLEPIPARTGPREVTKQENRMAFGCNANTIKLCSGRYFDLRDPKPDQFDITDIAGGLSRICRFGGQVPVFYSVAEHSWQCAQVAIADDLPTDGVLAVLLHDAAEAFIGDVVKPLKVMLPGYAAIEARVEATIEIAFGVDFQQWREQIKEIDHGMLIGERNALWPGGDGAKWTGEGECRLIRPNLFKWGPSDAESAFVGLFNSMQWRLQNNPAPPGPREQ